MRNGRDRLAAWIKTSKINQTKAAELLGMDEVSMSLIMRGKRTPGLLNAMRIEDVTGVPARSWLLTGVNKSRRLVSRHGGNRFLAKRKSA